MKEMIKEYISQIVENGKQEDMEKLSDMLDDTIETIKENDPEKYKEYKMCLYEMAYGEILTDEMKEKWVRDMKPLAKWTKEEVESVVKQYGLKVPAMSAYVIMNMLYSDMKSALGSGDDEESLQRYIQATNDWYFDEDATNTQEAKLYNYWKYIAK